MTNEQKAKAAALKTASLEYTAQLKESGVDFNIALIKSVAYGHGLSAGFDAGAAYRPTCVWTAAIARPWLFEKSCGIVTSTITEFCEKCGGKVEVKDARC